MTKMFFADRMQTFFTALICFVAVSSLALGDDRFAISLGGPDKLVVSGPKGEKAVEFSVPAIAQPVTIGGVSFQMSFGRNSYDQLTAILSPSDVAPVDLHFTVMGKSVDADKAVVTLIFSSNLKGVTIDAGYGGRVEVNSRRVRPSEPRP